MMFKDCGATAWVSLLLTLLALSLGVVALLVAMLSKSKPLAVGLSITALLLSFGIVGSGALGMFMGRNMAESAVSGEAVDPSVKERILEEGYAEASDCVTISLIFMVLPALLGAGATVASLLKKPQT